MFGLRAENDQSSKSFFSTAQNRKTYRFAERYNGRFFVSGVSGSFAKYTKQLKETDKKYLQNEKKVEKTYTYQPLLEKHQKEELRRDAQRLLEMEEQLNQLQKMRELKRHRDRARRKKKMEYNAACTIQRAYRRFRLYRANKSADILKSFLRTLAAQHSISAACWATQVLKKFAIKTSYLWMEKKFQQKMAKQVALKNWYNIRNAACIYTVARRATTDEFVFNCINAGARLATKAILDSGVMLRPKKVKGHSHKHGSEKRKHSHKHGANDHLQFFLTEFDGPDGNGDSVGTGSDGDVGFGSSSDDDSTDEPGFSTRKSLRLINKERSSVEGLTLSLQAAAKLRKLRPAKVYNANNPEHRRIMALHRQKLADYSSERVRRMKAVDQKNEQAEKEAAEKLRLEEQTRQANEQAKKEYYARLAHEERVKARAITKARMDKEAAKVKKQALEQQERAERAAMQLHDKACYQNLPSAPAAGVKLKKGVSVRPSSGRPTRAASPSVRGAGASAGAGSESDADWAVLPDPSADPATATGNAGASSKVAFPGSSKSVKLKAPVVVDQAAVDHQYYQSALPPKRPHVPRVNSENAVSMAKKKKEEEMAAIEQEALIQEEVRRLKFTSEEAVQRSRLAVKRRVAAKLEREAHKVKEAEVAEAERLKKLEQIAALAQQRLKADLEKKRRRAAERRRELGLDTPPDPYAVASAGLAAVKLRRRRKRKQTGATSESDASVSAGEAPISTSQQQGLQQATGKVGGALRQISAGGRYANIDEEGLTEDEGAELTERSGPAKGHSGGGGGEDSDDSFDPDEEAGDEQGDFDGEEEDGEQDKEEDAQDEGSENDSDSLDAMLRGLSQKPHALQPAQDSTKSGALQTADVSTRSNSAGANDSPVRSINRNTSSGGSDPRKLTATYYSSPAKSQPGTSERDRLLSAFERADITSAHENFEDLMENFEVENFFNQPSVVQLFRTNTSGELVEGEEENSDFPAAASSARRNDRNAGKGVAKAKLSTGASSKKLVIPKHLQNTPYFKHYKKHSEGGLAESKSSAQVGTEASAGANASAGDNFGHTTKASSKVPLLARKKQLADQAAGAGTGTGTGGIALGGSASAPTLPMDEDLLQFQQNQQKPGKVASLLEMVTKARLKLKKQGASGASDTDTDNEAAKNSIAQAPPQPVVAPMVAPVPAPAPHAAHAAHIMSALHAGPGSHAPGAHVHKVHPPNHPDPSRITPAASFAAAQAPAAINGLNYKASTDAELDAFVPSLQPPSVPQLLPMMSFRKAQSNIPLPPLSKDNLTILLKGKDPDSFAAAASAGAGFASSKGTVTKKVSKKASKKNVEAAPAPTAAVSKKASLPKEAMMMSEKKANVSKFLAAQSNKAQGRYASVESDEKEDEPQTLSPEQQYQQRLLRENLRQSQVRFAPDVEENEAEDANGSDSDHEDQLQAEYSRLREEFNAKLQQAAAFNQVRNSAKIASGEFAGASESHTGHGNDEGGEGYDGYDDAYQEGDGEGDAGEEQTAEEIASGSVTQSYSQGVQKVSTQELLRMWEIEDAEEEARKQTERSNNAQGSNQYSPDRDRELGGAGGARGVGYDEAEDDAQSEHDTDSEEEYLRDRRAKNKNSGGSGSTKPSAAASGAVGGAKVMIPATVVSVDDPSLDAECLSFLNKMSMKIPTK